MPRGVYERSKPAMPSPDHQAAPATIDPASVPGLIVPTNRAPSIDLTDPRDCPDRADDEWSLGHLLQFLARQPRDMVFIPKEIEELKIEGDVFQTVGYMGHWFTVRKGEAESVPLQIAEVIKNSQQRFPTQQSQLRKRQITDVRELPADPAGRGMAGAEAPLLR